MTQHLLIRLRAPLVAFGGKTIDNRGFDCDFPTLSMVTGLIANALGWTRGDFQRLDRLQARLVMGSRLNRGGERLIDFQTAEIARKDAGWTTSGVPESRRGGDVSYKSPHLRFRDHRAGLDAVVALRVEPDDEEPTLSAIAYALDRPKRPIFIGRKHCLPSSRLLIGVVDADNILDALKRADPIPVEAQLRFQWPEGEGTLERSHPHDIGDLRNWTSNVHEGLRAVFEGTWCAESATSLQSQLPELPA